MAATNPFRVSDLVAKYGWQAMIYLAALGIKDLAEVGKIKQPASY